MWYKNCEDSQLTAKCISEESLREYTYTSTEECTLLSVQNNSGLFYIKWSYVVVQHTKNVDFV